MRICPLCGSSFEDYLPWDGPEWMPQPDEPLLPRADSMFGHPVKWSLPWTAEGQAHQLKLRQHGMKTLAARPALAGQGTARSTSDTKTL